MNSIQVYLSGACKHVEECFQNWRDEFRRCIYEQYAEHNVYIIDPIRHFDYKNNLPKTDKECHDLFYYLIDKSDLLIVNLDSSDLSPGTVSEVHHAYIHNIPVIGFGNDEKSWYAWAKEECSVICENIDDVVNYLLEHYCIL